MAEAAADVTSEADRARLEQLWAEHADAVLGYAVLRGDRADAEEVVAEVFTVAWQRLDVVPDDPRPWLLGVARKVLANSRRGAGRRGALTERLASRAHVHRPAEPDPAEAVAERLRLVEALRRLPEADREVLVLVGVHGLEPRAAATVLGCSGATASVRLHRARRRLRAVLQVLDAEPPPWPTSPPQAPSQTAKSSTDDVMEVDR